MRTVVDILLGVRLCRCVVVQAMDTIAQEYIELRTGKDIPLGYQYWPTGNPHEYAVLRRRVPGSPWRHCTELFHSTDRYKYYFSDCELPHWVDTTQEP
jgi:hypothetical protein